MNCPYAHPGKSNFITISGPMNPMEAFMKNMMMSKNPNMFKQKSKKRPNIQDEKQEEQQQEQ